MRWAGVWLCGLFALAAIAGESQTTRVAMNQGEAPKNQLSRQITIGNKEGAKMLARELPAPAIGDVLKDTAGNEKASVRMLVLELASEYPSEGASIAILSRLQDQNLTVRSIANSLLGGIAQKNLVPKMFKAMGQDLDPVVKGALARQIGMIGDAGDLPQLRAQYRLTTEPGLRTDLALAMARLGDENSRKALIQQLAALDATGRVNALRDIPYVGDSRLARYFRPVLEDRRDVIAISLPHNPVVAGRICDLAIQALAALGLKFSFDTLPMRRFTDPEIEEATQIVTSLEKLE